MFIQSDNGCWYDEDISYCDWRLDGLRPNLRYKNITSAINKTAMNEIPKPIPNCPARPGGASP